MASLEAWANDAECRSLLQVLVGLPRPVQGRAIEYLGLFRPGPDRGLSWRRALKVAQELAELVGKNRIQWDNSEERPISPEVWGEALEAVVARRPAKLQNHNYLRHTAWAFSERLARHVENDRERGLRERKPSPPPARGPGESAGPCLANPPTGLPNSSSGLPNRPPATSNPEERPLPRGASTPPIPGAPTDEDWARNQARLKELRARMSKLADDKTFVPKAKVPATTEGEGNEPKSGS